MSNMKLFTKKEDPEYIHLTYPHNRPGPGRPDKRSNKIDIGYKIRPFCRSTPPIASFQDIDFMEIKAVGKNGEGIDQAIVFLETEKGSFSIKGSSDVALEYFNYLLYKALNINVPQTMIISWKQPVSRTIHTQLDKSSYHDETINKIVRGRLNIPFLFLMEYIPSVSLKELGEARAKFVFEPNYPNARERMIRLGMMIGMDSFINNCTRIPLIWETEEKYENLRLRIKTDFLTGEDKLLDPNNLNLDFEFFYAFENKPTLLNKDNNISTVQIFSKYTAKLEKFLDLLFSELHEVMKAKIDPTLSFDKTFTSVGSVTTHIYKYTNHRIKPMAEFQIMLGIACCYYNLANFTMKKVAELYKQVVLKGQQEDWQMVWTESQQRINLEFLADILGIFQKYMTKYDEVMNWVRVITLNQFTKNHQKEDMIWEKKQRRDKYKGDFQPSNPDEFIEESNIKITTIRGYGEKQGGGDDEFDESWAMEDDENKERSDVNNWLDQKVEDIFGIKSTNNRAAEKNKKLSPSPDNNAASQNQSVENSSKVSARSQQDKSKSKSKSPAEKSKSKEKTKTPPKKDQQQQQQEDGEGEGNKKKKKGWFNFGSKKK